MKRATAFRTLAPEASHPACGSSHASLSGTSRDRHDCPVGPRSRTLAERPGRRREPAGSFSSSLPIIRTHDFRPIELTSSPAPDTASSDFLDLAMKQVDTVIRQRLSSRVPLVEQIGHYIVEAGGKRMRPRLLLLFARAFGYEGVDSYELAAAVEFIHTATLLHDDVVDESSLRRGRATANASFGNAASVLVGDFLYSRAFQMMVSLNRMRVLDVVADATNVIAEGEVLQLMNMHDPDLAVEDYLQVIRFKTAKLFEASARLGAILGGADADTEETCADFGRRLGTAFQLVDDLLDYEGRSEELGKNVGDDIREGKATLPILLAMERGTPEEREMLRQAIRSGEVDKLAQVIDVVRRTGAIEATRQAAEVEMAQARINLQCLPVNRAREALLELSARAVHRSS